MGHACLSKPGLLLDLPPDWMVGGEAKRANQDLARTLTYCQTHTERQPKETGNDRALKRRRMPKARSRNTASDRHTHHFSDSESAGGAAGYRRVLQPEESEHFQKEKCEETDENGL